MFNAKRTGLLIVSIISFVLAFIFLGYIAQMLFSYIKTGYAIIGLVLISPIGLAYMALGVFFTVLAVVWMKKANKISTDLGTTQITIPMSPILKFGLLFLPLYYLALLVNL